MPQQNIEGQFQVEQWNETPHLTREDGGKITQAHVRMKFTEGIQGQAEVFYLMMYRPDKTAKFTGLKHVEGTLAGREGGFVLQVDGTFEAGVAQARWFIVPGSGSGDLLDLTGDGEFVAAEGPVGRFTLNVDFGS